MGLCRSHHYAVMMRSDDEVRVLTQSPRSLRVMLEARDLRAGFPDSDDN